MREATNMDLKAAVMPGTVVLRYILTREQVEELADKLPSAIKTQRKVVKHIIGEMKRMAEGDTLYIEAVSADGKTTVGLHRITNVKGSVAIKEIQSDLPLNVVRRYLAVKGIVHSDEICA